MTPTIAKTPDQVQNMKTKAGSNDLHGIAKRAGLDISSFDAKELLMGMDVEKEHNGKMGADTDVVPGNDQGTIMKIAIAHLREDPKYYTKLKKMESESLRRVQELIESRKITTHDFNIFIESLPKSNDERLARHTRSPKPYHDRNPGKKVDDVTDREGNNDPTKTSRGKLSVDRQAKRNQLHPDRFIEAVQFFHDNSDKELSECQDAVGAVKDKTALLALIMRLLGQSGVQLNRDWLRGIKGFAEGRDG